MMLRNLDQWLVSVILATGVVGSSIPVYSQSTEKSVGIVPAEVYDFGSSCHYLVELTYRELLSHLSHYNFFTNFCIYPEVSLKLRLGRRSADLITAQRLNGLRLERNGCFSLPEEFKGDPKEVNISLFLDCRVKSLSLVLESLESRGIKKTLRIKPTEGQTLNFGNYLSSQLIFPEIISSEEDLIYFSLRPSSIIPISGDWWLGNLKINKVDSQGMPPNEFPIFAMTGNDLKKPGKLTYTLGNLEFLVPFPKFKIISVQDELIERACSAPPPNVSEGDIVCVPSDDGLSEVRFENKDTSIRLIPVAQSSKTAYYFVPYSDFLSTITVSRAKEVDTIKINDEGNPGIHYCNCKARSELASGPGSALTAAEIKRLRAIVASAISDAEAVWIAGQKNLRITPNGMYNKKTVITIAEKGATIALAQL